MNVIYALVDPRSKAWRYIGQSTCQRERFKDHLWNTPKLKTKCAAWLRELGEAGLVFEIEILEELADASKLSAAEREWIEAARHVGVQLTNERNGGGGSDGRPRKPRRPVTPETRARLSAAALRRGEAFYRRVAATMTGRKRPEEVAAKMRGRKRPAAVVEKIKQNWRNQYSSAKGN